jgi:two-component system nitrogen regulation response regulator NtrX
MGVKTPDGDFTVEDLPPEITGKDAGNKDIGSGLGFPDFVSLTLREAREKFEKDYLKVQVERFQGNISQTAQFIGMERSALHRKLKSLDIYPNGKDNIAQEQNNKRKVVSG